ncbi:NAD(P)-dependent alcohol dehydrogenase [Microbacterium lacus]|uniref:NAD(P)-dependent alcohol dehydrogenase n=1 Tax=Microbacterium lacus TaxID=415217 RepID=UPI0038506EE2
MNAPHESTGTAAAVPLPRTMRIWRQRAYGSADLVTAVTAAVPTPRRKEVLVRVEAVSINSGDVHLMRGEPRMVRLFFGLRRPRVAGRGMDVAGTVVAIGADVTGLSVGDRVVGAGTETLADYVTVAQKRLSRLPENVSMADASTLPIAGNTAVTTLDACRVGEGSRVLVLGAGGGVGTLTVQLAHDRGAEVWATSGARAEDLVHRLGAERTFDYRTTPVASLPGDHFDAVIDIPGDAPLEVLRDRLRRGGVVALVGGDGTPVLGPLPRIFQSMFSGRDGRKFRSITATTKADVTARLVDLVAAGRLTPSIERTYTMAEASAALAHVENGRTVGKVVVVQGETTLPEA